MTKVTIISGFLGAGKTTLIKKLLKEAFAGEKCVLLENEYGEVGIDGGFMKDSGIEITELNSGCICCTLAGDFVQAIYEITERFNPDRLIIEPTGVGKLSDIRRVVEDAAKTLPIELAGACTVVDAAKCKMYLKNFGEFFIDQVKCAETVILSRTQLVSEEKLAAALELVRAQNADARIILTPWDEISGKIIIDGVDITQLSDREIPMLRRKIGMVFQDFRLLENKTVFENVAFAMEVVHCTQRTIRRVVPQVLALMGIEAKRDRFPQELSGGEQQRVAIARAIVNNPSIIIADEPTGNLDPDTAYEIMKLIEQINRRGTTVVIVTHDKGIVNRMRKRVVAIESGSIVRDDKEGEYGYDD